MPGSADLRAGASTTGRPTPAEEHEALGVIRAMKERDPPILATRAPARPNVVACVILLNAIVMYARDRDRV